MSPLEIVYVASFLLGGGYLALASVLHFVGGEGGGHDSDLDLDTDVDADLDADAGMDVDAGDVDAGDLDADADADAGDAGEAHDHGDVDGGKDVSFFSPLVMSVLLVGFGLMGFAVHHWLAEVALISLAAALAMGGGAGGGMWFTLKKMRQLEGGSQARVATLVGLEATVSVRVPARGYGEIIYVTQGQQFNTPAKSGTGSEIPKGSRVIIGGFDDEGTFLVDQLPTDRRRRLAALPRPEEDDGAGADGAAAPAAARRHREGERTP